MKRHAVPNGLLGFPGKPPNGGSHPRFYDFDDGVVRLVKWQNNVRNHGLRLCYNELVVSRLGQLIEAPVLRGTVVYVPDDIIPADHRPDAIAGFHFGSAYMDGENFKPTEHYKEIENSSQLAAAAVLLAWASVADQQGHNQYFQRAQLKVFGSPDQTIKRFRLIDLGWAFGGGSWTADSIDPDKVPYNAYTLPKHLAAATDLQKVEAAVTALNGLREEDVADCLSDFPDEWNVTAAEQSAVLARLLKIRPRLLDIIKAGTTNLQAAKAA